MNINANKFIKLSREPWNVRIVFKIYIELYNDLMHKANPTKKYISKNS